jgi:hypothetical protein
LGDKVARGVKDDIWVLAFITKQTEEAHLLSEEILGEVFGL